MDANGFLVGIDSLRIFPYEHKHWHELKGRWRGRLTLPYNRVSNPGSPVSLLVRHSGVDSTAVPFQGSNHFHGKRPLGITVRSLPQMPGIRE